MNADVYRRLVKALAAGIKVPRPVIDAALAAAGKTAEDLVDDVLVGDRLPPPTPGDPCEKCGGRLVVRNSKRRNRCQVQYLACGDCGERPAKNKRVVPIHEIHRRPARVLSVKHFGPVDPENGPTIE